MLGSDFDDLTEGDRRGGDRLGGDRFLDGARFVDAARLAFVDGALDCLIDVDLFDLAAVPLGMMIVN